MADRESPLTREERFRRVAILCCNFIRNLAYHRVGNEFPVGWKIAPLGPTASFWITLNGNFVETCLLEWCKLFADPRGMHSWQKIVADPSKFKAALLDHLGMRESEGRAFCLKMRRYRDKFIAHLDLERRGFIPALDIAKTSVEFYYAYLLDEVPGINFSPYPDTIAKFRLAYKEGKEIARAAYRESGLRESDLDFPEGGG